MFYSMQSLPLRLNAHIYKLYIKVAQKVLQHNVLLLVQGGSNMTGTICV